jgi:GNAT superfamily N-acetyltransferase
LEADVAVTGKSVHAGVVSRFTVYLSRFDTSWMQTAIELSCRYDDEEFFDSLQFESLSRERPLESIKFAPLPWARVDDYVAVMRQANERKPPVFDLPDFDHAREEIQFSLRPDIHRSPAQGPFARVDCWVALVEGEICGVIGIAIFTPPEKGCWITWYATQPGRKGLGSYLMALAASVAKARSFHDLYVWTGKTSEDAIGIYRRMGFKETQSRPPDLPVGSTDFAAFERSLVEVQEGYPLSLHLRS